MINSLTYQYFLAALNKVLQDKYKGNMAALARDLPFSHGHVVNIVSAIKPASYEAQDSIAKQLNYELFDFLDYGKSIYTNDPKLTRSNDILYIPKVYASPSAGGGSFEVSDDVSDMYAFRKDWLMTMGSPSSMVIMTVSGDSMAPYIMDGDDVMIDQSRRSLMPDKVFAVRVEDLIYLKYVDRSPGKIILRSHNKTYEPNIIDTEFLTENSFAVLGAAVWWGHQENLKSFNGNFS